MLIKLGPDYSFVLLTPGFVGVFFLAWENEPKFKPTALSSWQRIQGSHALAYQAVLETRGGQTASPPAAQTLPLLYQLFICLGASAAWLWVAITPLKLVTAKATSKRSCKTPIS